MRFPDDYPIEALRGLRRPRPSEIRRAMKKRVQYLDEKIGRLTAQGVEPQNNLSLDELAALAVLMDHYGLRLDGEATAPEVGEP